MEVRTMKNFKAEMLRHGVTVRDIQNALACSEKTARNKISGESEFGIAQAIMIRDMFFPGMRLEYLYAPDDIDKTA
jgi:hypothetical protein